MKYIVDENDYESLLKQMSGLEVLKLTIDSECPKWVDDELWLMDFVSDIHKGNKVNVEVKKVINN
jgi:hypothetical protein